MADDLLTPVQLGFDINTSNVVKYDGVTFVTLSPTINPDLNAVLRSVDVKVTDLQAQITAIPTAVDSTSQISTYDGTPTFTCFSFIGSTLNDIIDELGLQICINNTAIGALETTDIATGGSTPPMNAAPYAVGPSVTNADEALIAIDSAIQNLDTDKLDSSEATLVHNSGFSSHIISASDASIGSGAFDVDIPFMSFYFSPVLAPVAGGLIQAVSPVTIVVPASSDNYIDFNLETSTYVLISVANGAPEPAVPADHVRVTKAISDGVGIVSISSSFADRQATDGPRNIKRESVGTTQISDGAITDVKLAVSGATPGTFPFSTVTITDKGIATSIVSEVTLTALADEDFLKFDSGSSKWLNVPIVGGILPAGAVNGDVLTFNTGSGDWEPVAPIAFTAIPLSGTGAFPVTGDLELTNGVKLFVSTSSITWNTNDVTVEGDEFIVSTADLTISAESRFSANIIITESVAPGSPTTNGVVLYAADRGAIAGTSSLNIVTEDDTKHIIGDLVGFGTLLPDPSAAVEVNSTTGGFRVPNMTTGQRDAINGGVFAEGLIIYNTTNNQFQGRTNSQWINLG